MQTSYYTHLTRKLFGSKVIQRGLSSDSRQLMKMNLPKQYLVVNNGAMRMFASKFKTRGTNKSLHIFRRHYQCAKDGRLNLGGHSAELREK
jgi:hypothetical protein